MILCIFEILLLIAEKIFKNCNQDAPGNSDKTTAYMQIHVGNMSASVAEWLCCLDIGRTRVKSWLSHLCRVGMINFLGGHDTS